MLWITRYEALAEYLKIALPVLVTLLFGGFLALGSYFLGRKAAGVKVEALELASRKTETAEEAL